MIPQDDKIYIIKTVDDHYGTARHIGIYYTLVTFENSVPEPILNEDFDIISEITLFDEEYDE